MARSMAAWACLGQARYCPWEAVQTHVISVGKLPLPTRAPEERLQAHTLRDGGLVWKGPPQGGREDPAWGSVGGRAASPLQSEPLLSEHKAICVIVNLSRHQAHQEKPSPSHRPSPKPRGRTSAWRTGQGGCGAGGLRLPPSVTQEPPRPRNSTRCFVFFKITSLG